MFSFSASMFIKCWLGTPVELVGTGEGLVGACKGLVGAIGE